MPEYKAAVIAVIPLARTSVQVILSRMPKDDEMMIDKRHPLDVASSGYAYYECDRRDTSSAVAYHLNVPLSLMLGQATVAWRFIS